MRQWFIDWDAESWGSTDEFDDATPKHKTDPAAVAFDFGCRREATPKHKTDPAAVAFDFGCRLVSYLPSFSSLSTMFINIFRVFLLVAWWPFRITWKTLEILCHIIDALYDLIRFSLQRIRKLFVVLIFGMFFSVFWLQILSTQSTVATTIVMNLSIFQIHTFEFSQSWSPISGRA